MVFEESIDLLVSSFENEDARTRHTGCYLPKAEIKDCSVKIDGKNFFINQWMMILEHMKTLEELLLGQGYYYEIGSLLDYIILRRVMRWFQYI